MTGFTHLEPTLNELVSLRDALAPSSPDIPAHDIQCSHPISRRMRMEDIEVDGYLRASRDYAARTTPSSRDYPHGPSFPAWDVPPPPAFLNQDTHLWKYWNSHLVNSPLGPFSADDTAVLGDFLVFPGKVDDVRESVDPWDVSLNQDPPLYRMAFMVPPYISGMREAHVDLEEFTCNSW